jgi:uncharacterized DUF497 family protein
MELIFEWDDNKARLNRKNHQISFEEANYAILIRIISARKAMPAERKVYEENQT